MTIIQKGEPMSDLISRQAAINMLDEQIELCEKALYNWLPEKDRYAVKVEKASLTAYREKLKYLPAVQPDIIRCKDCKYYREYGYVNGKPKFLPKCTFNSIYVNVDDFCSRAERGEQK